MVRGPASAALSVKAWPNPGPLNRNLHVSRIRRDLCAQEGRLHTSGPNSPHGGALTSLLTVLDPLSWMKTYAQDSLKSAPFPSSSEPWKPLIFPRLTVEGWPLLWLPSAPLMTFPALRTLKNARIFAILWIVGLTCTLTYQSVNQKTGQWKFRLYGLGF